MLTVYSQLVACESDALGYITYVFKCLEPNPGFGHNYIMVTRFPNWESYIPNVGEKGFLTYNSVTAGEDTYYNRETDSIMKYNFSNLVFEKFVREKVDNFKKDIIL